VDRVSAIGGFGIHVNRGHGAAHIMCAALHSKYIMTLMQSMGSSSLCVCVYFICKQHVHKFIMTQHIKFNVAKDRGSYV